MHADVIGHHKSSGPFKPPWRRLTSMLHQKVEASKDIKGMQQDRQTDSCLTPVYVCVSQVGGCAAGLGTLGLAAGLHGVSDPVELQLQNHQHKCLLWRERGCWAARSTAGVSRYWQQMCCYKLNINPLVITCVLGVGPHGHHDSKGCPNVHAAMCNCFENTITEEIFVK